jgi:hypothetical protein
VLRKSVDTFMTQASCASSRAVCFI